LSGPPWWAVGASAAWAVSCMVRRGVFGFGFVAGFKWGFPSCLSGPLGLYPTFVTNFFFFFLDGILAITKPFSRTFFSRWNFGYHEAFLTNFFFFSRWNFGYHEAFLTNFFLFSRWNFGYHEAFLTNFFFFHDGILAITKPFSRTFSFFHDGIFGICDLG
jgi:hypothetical protein